MAGPRTLEETERAIGERLGHLPIDVVLQLEEIDPAGAPLVPVGATFAPLV